MYFIELDEGFVNISHIIRIDHFADNLCYVYLTNGEKLLIGEDASDLAARIWDVFSSEDSPPPP